MDEYTLLMYKHYGDRRLAELDSLRAKGNDALRDIDAQISRLQNQRQHILVALQHYQQEFMARKQELKQAESDDV